MNNDAVQPQTDEDWAAYSDAEALANAEEIKLDEKRLEKALKWSAKMAADKQKDADRLNSLKVIYPNSFKKQNDEK